MLGTVFVIVLKMTVLDLDSPVMLSSVAFGSMELCQYALDNEPHSDKATCRAMKLIAQKQKPKGEPVEP